MAVSMNQKVKKEPGNEDLATPSSSRRLKCSEEKNGSPPKMCNPTNAKENGESLLFVRKKSTESTVTIKAGFQQAEKSSSKQNQAPVDGLCCSRKTHAIKQAKDVISKLEPKYPCFWKSMAKSHVAGCFWMGLPVQFCKQFLPKRDATVTLKDESGLEHGTKYIADKMALSAGWRQFSVEHNLLEGDVLIFQLREPTKFTIHIVKANDPNAVGAAFESLKLETHVTQNDSDMLIDAKDAINDSEKGETDHKSTGRKRASGLLSSAAQKKCKKAADQFVNDSIGSEVVEGSKFSELVMQFKDIRSFEDFKIVINGMRLDSELSENVQNKYYALCCSQNAFLHDHLLRTLSFNRKLMGGIISETVKIADGLRACDLTTPRNVFVNWEKTLKSFELLGMDTGFLIGRSQRLVSLVFESEGGTAWRRYADARMEQARAEEELRELEAMLAQLKEASLKFISEVENLRSKAESYELKFQDEVRAPW